VTKCIKHKNSANTYFSHDILQIKQAKKHNNFNIFYENRKQPFFLLIEQYIMSTHKNIKKRLWRSRYSRKYSVSVLAQSEKIRSYEATERHKKDKKQQSLLWPRYDVHTPVRRGLRLLLDALDNLSDI
jgi:hypothetical protein